MGNTESLKFLIDVVLEGVQENKQRIDALTTSFNNFKVAANANTKAVDQQSAALEKLEKELEKTREKGKKAIKQQEANTKSEEKATVAAKKYNIKLSETTTGILKVEQELKKYFVLKAKGLTISGESEKQYKKLIKVYEKSGGKIEKLTAQQKALNAAKERSHKISKSTTTSINKETGGITQNTATVRKHIDANGRSISTTTKQSKVLEAANGQWLLGSKSMDKLLKKMNAVRWAMVNVTFALAGAAAVAAPLAILIKYGMKLEDLFTRIEVVTGAMADKALEDIKRLRTGTMYSIEEMGEGFLEFAKQGFSAGDTIMALTPIMALATIGFTDMKTATKIVAQSMHEFNLQAKDAAHIADVLASAANKSAADVETFGIAMSYAGPIAQQAGISFEETAASLAILSNMGLTASKAGTSFAAALTMMIKPTDDVKKKMRDIGITFFDAEGKMKDVDKITRELSAALGGLSDEKKLKFLTETFGRRGARAIAGLMTAMEGGMGTIKSFTDEISESNYALENMLKLHETTSGRLKIAWGEFKSGFTGMGESFKDVFSSILESWNDQTLRNKIGKLNEEITELGGTTIPLFVNVDYGRLGEIEKRREELGNIQADPTISRNERRAAAKEARELYSEMNKIMANREDRIESLTTTERFYLNEQSKLITSGKELKTIFETLDIDKAFEVEGLGNVYDEIIKLIGITEKDMNFESWLKYQEKVSDIQRGILTQQPNKITENIKSYTTQIKQLVGDITPEFAIQAKLTGEQAALLSDIVSNVETIDMTNPHIRDVLKEILKIWIGIGKEQDKHITSHNAAIYAYENLLNLSTSKTAIPQLKELQEAADEMEDLVIKQDVDGKDAGQLAKYQDMTKLLYQIESQIVTAKLLGNNLKYYEEQIDITNDSLEIFNGFLDIQKDKLDDLKDSLRDVNDEIKELSSPRFTGQLEVERLISNVELFIKKQNLADYGVIDAQKFLQDAVNNTNGNYQNLIDTIDEVNSLTDTSKDSYEAWRETLRETIRDLVLEGNLQSKNLSELVKQQSTLLLSTSKFGDEQSKQSKTVSLLKDAYDVYYGGMGDDVKYAIDLHKEAGRDIYDSSQEVISGLNQWWGEEARLNGEIEITESNISSLSNVIDSRQETLKNLQTSLKDVTDELSDMVDETWEAVRVLLVLGKLRNIGGGKDAPRPGVTGGSKKYTRKELEEEGTWSEEDIDHIIAATGGESTGGEQNDFVMRPGQKPVPFSSGDTIIGTKGGLPTGDVNINSLTLNGASGDPQEFVEIFTKELRRQMRT